MPTIQQLVQFRREVVDGHLHGIISLHALLEPHASTFETQPGQVFAATYPSEALTRLLQRLQASLSARDVDRKGNFVISGGYGSGKSHVLLALYHILAHPDQARAWLAEHNIDFTPPPESVVVLMPMTQLTEPETEAPVQYLWKPIFTALGYTGFQHTGSNFPTSTDLRKATAGRKVFVILDEIERWFMPIQDRHQAEANLSFLQNLTEFARDPDNGLYLFLTLLMLEPRISNIVGRDDAFFDDLTKAPDRRQVVLYRLVQSVDVAGAEQVVNAYLDQYRPLDAQLHVADYGAYRAQMLQCYPFHPETISVVFERYSSVARKEDTSYQNSRGALYLLAHVVQETLSATPDGPGHLQDRDLLLPGDVSLAIERLTDDLVNLDPRLVEIARDNVARSLEQGTPNAAPILSTVLLHSLGDPRTERRLGASFGDVLFGALRPRRDHIEPVTAASIEMALQDLEGVALNLHLEPSPPRWLFKAEMNIAAQINRRARAPEIVAPARNLVTGALKELVGGSVYVHGSDEIPDQREVTLVLTTARLESEEILQQLYYGRSYLNALVIVDPRDMASVTDDPDLTWIARRIVAAEAIRLDQIGDPDAQQRVTDFLDGASGARQALRNRLIDRYGDWRAPIFDPDRGDLTFTRIPVALNRPSILRAVEQRYDAARFRQNVMEAVESRPTPPTVADVRDEFLRQRSFAKPVRDARPSDEPIDRAIRDLVAEARLEIVKGGDERYICGSDPGYLQPQWAVAVPPEMHKPQFRLDQAVRTAVIQHTDGVTVQQVRQQCQQQAARFPEAIVDAGAVDAALVDLLARREIQTPQGQVTAHGALPDDLVLRPAPPGGAVQPQPTGPQPLSLGPGNVPQLKTDLVRLVDKPDRLSQVTVIYRCTLHGADLDSRCDLVGLERGRVQDAVLVLNWTLRETPATNRDGLLALLSRLPYPNIAEVTVHLSREKSLSTSA